MKIDKSLLDKFPFRATFTSDANFQKLETREAVQLAKASVEQMLHSDAMEDEEKKALEKVLPKIDFEKNFDLLGLAFEGNEVNVCNRNGEGIGSDVALLLAETCPHKPLNMEHSKFDIVGHLTNCAFKRGDKTLQASEVENDDQPYKMCYGAVVYRVAHQGFANYLEEVQEEGEYEDFQYKASWEIAYRDYDLYIGNNQFAKATLVPENQKEEYSGYLLKNGGTGYDKNGLPVFRRIKGEALLIGFALTTTPAADVKPVIVASQDWIEEKKSKKEEKNSESTVVVNEESNDTMDIKEQLKQFEEALASFKGVSEANNQTQILSLFKDSLEAASEKFAAEKAEQERVASEASAKAEKAAKDLEKAQEKITDLASKLSDAEKQLQDLNAKQEEARAANIYDGRMDTLKEVYDFSDEELKIVASQVAKLSIDEQAFEEYKATAAVIFAGKVRQKKEEQNDLGDAQSNASTHSQPTNPAKKREELVKNLSESVEIK